MRHPLRPRHVALIALVCAAAAACVTSPAAAARQAQQMNDLSDAINDARTENAALATTVDSLRTALAKHDSTIVKLANAAGIQIVK